LLLIASAPVADPAAVGANRTCNVPDWFGFSVMGKLPPIKAKPAPVVEAELIVTADVPDDFSVNDCDAEELTPTLPNARLVAPSVS
jgi:hypothetical protein